jgi:hypothetical protein
MWMNGKQQDWDLYSFRGIDIWFDPEKWEEMYTVRNLNNKYKQFLSKSTGVIFSHTRYAIIDFQKLSYWLLAVWLKMTARHCGATGILCREGTTTYKKFSKLFPELTKIYTIFRKTPFN